jgi:chromosome segregation ATPase
MQSFREETETKLAEYEKDIDQLQAKAEKLEGDAKAKVDQQMAKMRQKRDVVSEKMMALGTSSKNAWEEMKLGIDEAMQDLVSAYNKAAAEFSKP